MLISNFSVPETKIRVIWNPVSLNNIELKMDETLNDNFFISDIPILISVGNPSHVKGQWHLIRVLFEINKTLQCKLAICGNGSLSPYLVSMVEYYQLDNMVYFQGEVHNVYKYLKHSSCFVLSSLSEGFGVVLVEAMACGCPIVSSNCPYGPAEILEDGKYGLLCESQEDDYPDWESPLTPAEADMMDKIMMMLTDDALRLSFAEKGKERAKMFDSEIAVKKYYDLISEIE
jgi:glycosyltransferase involved in cell wall biosynthesis